jgi:murein L,D-transpeptidase YcbB/YkuD
MKKYLLLPAFSWLFFFSSSFLYAQRSEPLKHPQLTKQFYELSQTEFFWYRDDVATQRLRQQLPVLINNACQQGLLSAPAHPGVVNNINLAMPADTAIKRQLDRYFTDAALTLLLAIYKGEKDSPWFGYDAVTEKFDAADQTKILLELRQVSSAEELADMAKRLEPDDSMFKTFKQEYQRHSLNNRKDSARLIRLSMNYYRWMTHFGFEKMIVINQPAARLYYYENNKPVLEMKTVLGKTATPSPRFAAWCDQAILYPYWYVPRSITFNEYLPIIRRNPSWLDAKNMQVIDGNGKVVNHHQLNWSAFHSGYFPYTIRQSTGCDNALGVIKFNINTPYGVYLHDTNNKSAFHSNYRYLSHGCIRLEDPYELGYHLLEHTLDTAFLQSCYRQQKPVYETLKQPVPVFTVYMPAWPGPDGKMIYYKDVYRLLKK